MSRTIRWVKTMATALVLTGTLGWGNVQAKELTWTGCGITKQAFMGEIATAYELKTGTKIALTGGGATKGIRAVSAGTADLGGTCRHQLMDAAGKVIPEEENARLVQVAWDALVVTVHPSNPVESIRLADLKRVFDGEVTNWKELGGPDLRIALVGQEGKDSGVGHMLRLLVFNNPNEEFKARSLKVKVSDQMEEKVEQIPGALSIDGVSSARKRKVKFLSLDGVSPSKDNIASGQYPLYRPLYLTIAQAGNPDAQGVVDFLLSPEGQKIVSEQGTVNLAEGAGLVAPWEARKAAFGK
ncbi:MAG: phosphate ABC transporter substrate-binding protein [Magnetococcus sp. WYHC-3]